MSTCESVNVKKNSVHFDWNLVGNKIRDGRFGPVFTAIRPDTTDFITAEKVTLHEPGTSSVITERLIPDLERAQIHPSQPNVVSYLGYQLKEGHIFILTEHSTGGTLRDFVQRFGAIPQCLACSILRQIILGLEQLQAQGFAAVFLDSNIVRIDNKGGVKIEAPLLDILLAGQPLSPTILTLPELILGQQSLRKADVWLLGIIAAQLLTGDRNIAEANSAGTVAAQIKQAQGSAWELSVPQDKLDEQASDFLRQCLTFDVNERPSISEVKEHSFLNVKQ